MSISEVIPLLRELSSTEKLQVMRVVAAHLDAASVRYFVSENRHFLVELADLPFEVLTAEEVLRRLG